MRVVFLGDSLTEGVGGASYLDALGALVAADPLLAETDLINAGCAGDTALNLARRIPRDVAPHQPDWVVVYVGANDVTTALIRRPGLPTLGRHRTRRYFRDQRHIVGAITPARFADALRLVVDTLSEDTSARIAICSPATVDETVGTRAWRLVGQYAAVARQVAVERGCASIDLYARFTAAIARQAPRPLAKRALLRFDQALGAVQARDHEVAARRYGLTLTGDGVHLTQRGAALVATILHDWLRGVHADRTAMLRG